MNLRKFNKNLKKEFNNTFKDEIEIIEPVKIKKHRFNIRFRFAYVFIVLFAFLFIQHITLSMYNNGIDKFNNELISSNNNELTKIDETKNISSQLNYVKSKKESILNRILSIQIGCAAKGGMNSVPTVNEGNNSYNTNIQEDNIDEADIAKCDGKFIYSMTYETLYIYDLSGKIVDSEIIETHFVSSHYSELYIYNDKVICVGESIIKIYSFDGFELSLYDSIEYGRYISSRLINNELYIVSGDYLYNILNKEDIDNLYYDNCINPNYVIVMHKYNLDTKEYNQIEIITSNTAILYASENNFYIASRNYTTGNFTYITIIDYNLNPVGSVTVEGTINNQFSMDEHNNYIRVVSTDTTKDPLNYNQISIYSLDTLERVGYLNEGIGLSRHTVRSVRYDGDTCYVVTYMNKDPLYEIDLSDVTNPKIVSAYEAPGYSTYLHTFIINNQKYAFGIGYDDAGDVKISVYIDNGNETIQIGKDVLIVPSYLNVNGYDADCYIVDRPIYTMANNHKSLFVYNDNEYLYIGGSVSVGKYVVFKIDVNQPEHVISVYKEYTVNIAKDTRSFLINDKLYVIQNGSLIIDNWN